MPDMLAVNTSPLVFFGDAGHLDLLRVAAPRVVVPEPVWSELMAGASPLAPVDDLVGASWLERVDAAEPSDGLRAWDLGRGETSVIAWACAQRDRGAAAGVVMDDLAGRRCARSMGLPVVGTLGLVILGYRQGLVDEPRRVLEELRANGMWLADAVLDRALREAGVETTD